MTIICEKPVILPSVEPNKRYPCKNRRDLEYDGFKFYNKAN